MSTDHSPIEFPEDMSRVINENDIDVKNNRFPYCIVWTPIPVLTWLFPVIGHMGIALSNGVIRDFAGSYFVSEDNMAFGNPTKYWKLDPDKVKGSRHMYDQCVLEACEVYKTRTHNLCCDNCHSHVALALNKMNYDHSSNWNMVKLTFLILIHSKYVGPCAIVKTWLPFIVLCCVFVAFILPTQYS